MRVGSIKNNEIDLMSVTVAPPLQFVDQQKALDFVAVEVSRLS